MQLKVILKFEGVSKVSRHLKIIFSSKIFLFAARKILIINHFVIPEIKRVIRGNACLGKRPFGEMSFV